MKEGGLTPPTPYHKDEGVNTTQQLAYDIRYYKHPPGYVMGRLKLNREYEQVEERTAQALTLPIMLDIKSTPERHWVVWITLNKDYGWPPPGFFSWIEAVQTRVMFKQLCIEHGTRTMRDANTRIRFRFDNSRFANDLSTYRYR